MVIYVIILKVIKAGEGNNVEQGKTGLEILKKTREKLITVITNLFEKMESDEVTVQRENDVMLEGMRDLTLQQQKIQESKNALSKTFNKTFIPTSFFSVAILIGLLAGRLPLSIPSIILLAATSCGVVTLTALTFFIERNAKKIGELESLKSEKEAVVTNNYNKLQLLRTNLQSLGLHLQEVDERIRRCEEDNPKLIVGEYALMQADLINPEIEGYLKDQEAKPVVIPANSMTNSMTKFRGFSIKGIKGSQEA